MQRLALVVGLHNRRTLLHDSIYCALAEFCGCLLGSLRSRCIAHACGFRRVWLSYIRVPWSRSRPMKDYQIRAVGTGELTKTECHGRAAVVMNRSPPIVSAKTGIFTDTAGDFRPILPQLRQTGSPVTKANARKARISGLFSRLFASLGERRNGWLRREDSNLDMGEFEIGFSRLFETNRRTASRYNS